MKAKTIIITSLILISQFAFPVAVHAATNGEADLHDSTSFQTILFLAILLLAAKVGGIIEKFGVPAVLGELLAGVVLSIYGFLGLALIDDIRHNEIVMFFAQFGAVLLLFQVGLESNIRQMMKVGTRSLMVALAGVLTPFLLGTYFIGPVFFPEASFTAHLFIGASIVATSVGITATVFKGLGISKSNSAQTVIGAAVIDDILGLLLLAIVSSFAAGHEVTVSSVALLTVKSFSFLGIAILLGQLFAERISRFFSLIHTGTGMKLGIVIIIALSYAYAATLFGLEPIVGAFAAGLILDAVHFRFFDLPKVAYDLERLKGHNQEERKAIHDLKHDLQHTHVEDMVEGIGLIFIPMFFTFTGLQINIASLLNPQLYLVALVCSVIAILSKLVAGFVIRGDLHEKLLIGFSMVPRGEVGLIFLSIGRGLGAINDDLFSTLLIVIVVTTFVAPIAIKQIASHIPTTQPKLHLAHRPVVVSPQKQESI